MTNWRSWDTINKAVGKKVLVKFNIGGIEHIEDATIYNDNGDNQPYYVLFDGDSFNVKVEPVGWMEIPD